MSIVFPLRIPGEVYYRRSESALLRCWHNADIFLQTIYRKKAYVISFSPQVKKMKRMTHNFWKKRKTYKQAKDQPLISWLLQDPRTTYKTVSTK